MRWSERLLLTVAALFVCFTVLLTGTGEAKGKTCRLMSIESHEVEVDGRAHSDWNESHGTFMHIQIK